MSPVMSLSASDETVTISFFATAAEFARLSKQILLGDEGNVTSLRGTHYVLFTVSTHRGLVFSFNEVLFSEVFFQFSEAHYVAVRGYVLVEASLY